MPNTTGEGFDSDITGINGPGTTAVINVAANTINNDVDAGLYQAVRIGNFVWNDTGADNSTRPHKHSTVYKIQESYLNQGITVILRNLAGVEQQRTYAVMVMVPSGSTVSPNDAVGSTDVNDSDINPTTGTSPNITVTSGSTNNTIDAGLYQAIRN